MKGLIHINIAKIDFYCPHCRKQYLDDDDKYLNRCNKNKTGFTTIKCICQERFGMTYNIQGDAVGFEL